MDAQTKNSQDNLTPQGALRILVEGNNRFVQSEKVDRNHLGHVDQTSTGQFPFAVVLSCIDSRVPVELVFDQGIGDIFSTRVAGNIINEDVLGSMEYACKVAGSKLLVVLGHTKCGAVKAAFQGVELGNITPLLLKIKPAVDVVKSETDETSDEVLDAVAMLNVRFSIDKIRADSPILSEMEKDGQIEIVGAIYNVSNGKVEFLEG